MSDPPGMTYIGLPRRDASTPSPPHSAARQALLDAFAGLALSRRYRDFGVDAIVRSACVARSTFYYHFSGKDDLLLQNLQPFIAALADMASTAEPSEELQYWVEHIWQQRGVACRLLEGPTGRKIEAALVERLNQTFAGTCQSSRKHHDLLAHQIAGASLSLLKAWVTHRVTAAPSDIAHNLWHGATSIGARVIGR